MPLVANKVTERELRRWLSDAGYFGRSAKITSLDLVAIARPGWVQLFRFELEAKHEARDRWEPLRGLLRDDDREGFEVRTYEDDAALEEGLDRWSEGLIVRRRRRQGAAADSPAGLFAGAAFVTAVVTVTIVIALWSR